MLFSSSLMMQWLLLNVGKSRSARLILRNIDRGFTKTSGSASGPARWRRVPSKIANAPATKKVYVLLSMLIEQQTLGSRNFLIFHATGVDSNVVASLRFSIRTEALCKTTIPNRARQVRPAGNFS